MGMVPNILFSDIDGTFVHYEKDDGSSGFRSLCDNVAESVMDGRRCEIIKLPPASSGSRGAISVKTLKLFAAVRALGVKLVIISGCRSSTLFERMPFLPMADAYVCESGGRIFYPCSTIPSALYLEEDTAWRETHVAAGPPGQEKTQPEKRHGILWEFYDRLMANDPTGTVLDARNYTTAFRVKLAAQFEPVPAGLKSASNLGVIDIFPETSGKKNAAFYLMERFLTYDSVFMCGKIMSQVPCDCYVKPFGINFHLYILLIFNFKCR